MHGLVSLSPTRTSFSISTISFSSRSRVPQTVSTACVEYKQTYFTDHPDSFEATILAPEPTQQFARQCVECDILLTRLVRAQGQPYLPDVEADALQHFHRHDLMPAMNPYFRTVATCILDIENTRIWALVRKGLGIIDYMDVEMTDADMVDPGFLSVGSFHGGAGVEDLNKDTEKLPTLHKPGEKAWANRFNSHQKMNAPARPLKNFRSQGEVMYGEEREDEFLRERVESWLRGI
jgi:hypothetical protein